MVHPSNPFLRPAGQSSPVDAFLRQPCMPGETQAQCNARGGSTQTTGALLTAVGGLLRTTGDEIARTIRSGTAVEIAALRAQAGEQVTRLWVQQQAAERAGDASSAAELAEQRRMLEQLQSMLSANQGPPAWAYVAGAVAVVGLGAAVYYFATRPKGPRASPRSR